MYFFFLTIAYNLCKIVNAIPYIGLEDSSGIDLANADVENDQLGFISPLPGPGNVNLFSDFIDSAPNEQNALEEALLPDLGEAPVLLTNSGISTDDQINYDLFPKDYSDAGGSGLDGMGTTFEINASELNIGPCGEPLLNLCCTDSRYQNENNPEKGFPIVAGCEDCEFYDSTFFLDSRCFLADHCSNSINSAHTLISRHTSWFVFNLGDLL